LRYLEEGRGLIDRDPVQASEKLYKAAEEVVKAVRAIARKIGGWFVDAWDAANYLHVWGFHEAKLEPDDIMIRLPHIERMVSEAQKLIKG